jgi:hypothetical protein
MALLHHKEQAEYQIMALLAVEIVLLVAKLGWIGAALVVVFLAARVNYLAPSGRCYIALHASELAPLSKPTSTTHGGLAKEWCAVQRVSLLSH